MSMGQWILITRILRKYNKCLSSLIAEFIKNFIEIHIHILHEDKDIANIIQSHPGISSGALGEKLFNEGRNSIVRNYVGKPARLEMKKRVNKRFLDNVDKVIDDEGQFK
jgi:hypothetical protein